MANIIGWFIKLIRISENTSVRINLNGILSIQAMIGLAGGPAYAELLVLCLFLIIATNLFFRRCQLMKEYLFRQICTL